MKRPTKTLNGSVSVPFVITKTKVQKEPSVKRKSRFVGFREGLRRLVTGVAFAAMDMVEEAFFEKEEEVDDGGILNRKHYAIFVRDEAGLPELTVEEMPFRPPCAAHFELVTIADEEPRPQFTNATPQDPESREKTRQHLMEMLLGDQGTPGT